MLSSDRHHNRIGQVVDVVWDKIGQMAILGMIPDLFDRIQFGCIGGDPFDLQLIRIPCLQDRYRGAMPTPPIPYEHDLAPYHTQQMTDKGDHILRINIMLIQPKIKCPTASVEAVR